jgi:hypothetical protein
MTISDAPSCGITYNCHSDDSRGINYDCNICIIKAKGPNVPKHFKPVIYECS